MNHFRNKILIVPENPTATFEENFHHISGINVCRALLNDHLKGGHGYSYIIRGNWKIFGSKR